MSKTPIYDSDELEEDSASPEVPINEMVRVVERAANATVSWTITTDVLPTKVQMAEGFFHELNGSPSSPFAFGVPAVARHFCVINNTGKTCSVFVQGLSGAGVSVADGETVTLRCDGTNLEEIGGGGGGDFERIGNVVVTAGSQSSITWSGLDAYESVEIRGIARGFDAVEADVALQIQFNGDTGLNYGYAQLFFQNNVTSGPHNNTGQNSIMGPQIPAGGTTAGYAGAFVIECEGLRSTIMHKHVIGRCAEHRTGTGQRGMATAGQWFSLAAVTSITLGVSNGFLDGSRVSAWGRKAA